MNYQKEQKNTEKKKLKRQAAAQMPRKVSP